MDFCCIRDICMDESMKKYIFLTNSIRFIGGSQLYISRKVDYLRKQGWQVEVYYTDYGPIMIDNLRLFTANHFPVFCFPIEYVSKKERKKILEKFEPNEETIIETHLVHLSIWGEYIAKYIGAKHIAYFLCEQFPPLSNGVSDYLKFKLRQNLLYGITSKSIPALFRENVDGTPYSLSAVGCHAGVGGIESRIEQLPEADYTILSLGRLDKPYIPNMVESVREFAEIYEEKKINLLVIGDSPFREKLLEPLKSRNNVLTLMLGELTPIPRNAFLASDVAIATSGCATLTSLNDVPTIAIDGNDFYAIGINGYTTSNTLFRNSNEPQLKIKDLLEDVLVKKMYPKKGIFEFEGQELDYSAHQAIIDQEFDKSYYDVLSIDTSKPLTIENLVARCWGWKAYLKYAHLKVQMKLCIKKIFSNK
mgnify:CR=1 FL=1